MERITLKGLLPLVFMDMRNSSRICSSQIWEEPSLVFSKGCRLCIHAESGSGKSSLLSFIYGNRNDYKGEILFDDTDIRSFSVEKWCEVRTKNLSLLPQEMRLFPELTVAQNISLKNNRTNHKSAEQIDEYLNSLGLSEKKNIPVGKLSIGQQQRVALIRSLCQPFDFLFLDEPVSHLDERNNQIIAEMVEEEAARQGAGVVATSVGNHLLLKDAEFISL